MGFGAVFDEHAGQLIVKEAVERGMDVTALVRSENKTVAEKVVMKDLMDITSEDLAGFDAVVDAFVEDAGWNAAALRYRDYLEARQDGKVLYLELGVGANTPVIIKYPFWHYTYANPQATYACVNYGEAYTHDSIADRSILLQADIDRILDELIASDEAAR